MSSVTNSETTAVPTTNSYHDHLRVGALELGFGSRVRVHDGRDRYSVVVINHRSKRDPNKIAVLRANCSLESDGFETRTWECVDEEWEEVTGLERVRTEPKPWWRQLIPPHPRHWRFRIRTISFGMLLAFGLGVVLQHEGLVEPVLQLVTDWFTSLGE